MKNKPYKTIRDLNLEKGDMFECTSTVDNSYFVGQVTNLDLFTLYFKLIEDFDYGLCDLNPDGQGEYWWSLDADLKDDLDYIEVLNKTTTKVLFGDREEIL